jgi:hypothetical protein
MIALLTLAACAAIPWSVGSWLHAWFGLDWTGPPAARERALARCHRAALVWGLLLVPAAAVAGALVVDPALSTRWPTAGAWFYASLCATMAWAGLALGQRTPDEARTMPALETMGRVVQMALVPVIGVGLALLGSSFVGPLVPVIAPARAALGALWSVTAVVVVSPWLALRLGLWPLLPISLDSGGKRWRVAHLPAPSPFFTHVAALPWLRTVVATDWLLKRAPDSHWRALLRYEVGTTRSDGGDRAARWSIAVLLSAVLFLAASAIGAEHPGKLVAATFLATLFTGAAGWWANREPAAAVGFDADGPSMQELAQTLRSLPPTHGQALPRTSHRPLGGTLYDRLFALGHDPGRRPHA